MNTPERSEGNTPERREGNSDIAIVKLPEVSAEPETITPVAMCANPHLPQAGVLSPRDMSQYDMSQAPNANPHLPSPALCYLARLAPGSRRSVRQALEVIAGLLTDGRVTAETLPWHLLRYEHTQAVRASLAERYSPGTASKMIYALRGVLAECHNLGIMSAEAYQAAARVQKVKGETLLSGRGLSRPELAALFRSCAEDAVGVRDGAILVLLYGAGLRRSEAVLLTLADLDLATGAVKVIAGKGNRDRLAYVAESGCVRLGEWLRVRGPEPGPVLTPVSRTGTVMLRPITAEALVKALKRRAEKAGVADFSPHDLRRSFVSDLLDAGADLAVAQKLAGHASPVTTAKYDRRPEAAKKRAANLLDDRL